MNLPTQAQPSRRILLVCRPSTLQIHLESLLRGAGHVVHRVGDRAEAIASLHREPVDGVILDLMLPGAEAIGSMIAIRATRASMPVLAVSPGAAHGPGHLLPLARSLGAMTLVADPLEPARLLECVASWVPAGARQVAC